MLPKSNIKMQRKKNIKSHQKSKTKGGNKLDAQFNGTKTSSSIRMWQYFSDPGFCQPPFD